MTCGRKFAKNLARRVSWWNNLVAIEMTDAYTKVVRRPDGKPASSYRRPGSQNGRK